MKKSKRLLAFLLSFFLVFSVIPGNLLQVDAAKKKVVKVKSVNTDYASVMKEVCGLKEGEALYQKVADSIAEIKERM